MVSRQDRLSLERPGLGIWVTRARAAAISGLFTEFPVIKNMARWMNHD